MITKLIEYKPPRIAMALLIFATFFHASFPVQSSYLYSSTFLSVALVSAGFAVMMLAWWQFKERKVAICPTADTDYLITDGIYRLTRNPMYLGMVTMLVGVAVFFGTLPFYAVTIEGQTLGIVRVAEQEGLFSASAPTPRTRHRTLRV